MQKESKIEIIRKAAIAANPEIVELKFGCEIKDETGFPMTIWKEMPKTPQGKRHFKTCTYQSDYNEKWEIIGRPITLADVLMAILDENENVKYMVTYDALMLMTLGSEGAYWNLALPLSGQSEETIDFIFNILNNE